MSKHDPDQNYVYYAEQSVFESTLFSEPVSDADFKMLADRLFASQWWVRHDIPVPKVEATRRESSRSYARIVSGFTTEAPAIRVALHDVTPHTLAHEAAHVAQYYFYSPLHNPDLQSHGPEFVATYIAVAGILLGVPAAERLREAFERIVPKRTDKIITVPMPTDFDPEGIFPKWRRERQTRHISDAAAKIVGDLSDSPAQSDGLERINGAILL